jgi:acyl carrier protein
MNDQLKTLILRVADDVREQEGLATDTPIAEDTPLFGDGGVFDSMGLVSLVVAVEQAIDEELGHQVALADEKALSQKSSPYRTVATLAEYAAAQLQA